MIEEPTPLIVTRFPTIVNGIVTIVALGITTITAVQAETADYITGTITATLTIIKATPTLVFSTPAKTIGSPTFLITPTPPETKPAQLYLTH